MNMKNKKYFVSDLYSYGEEHQLVVKSFIELFESRHKNTRYLLNKNYRKHNIFNFIINDSLFKRSIFKIVNREVFKVLNLFLFIPYIILTKRNLVLLGMSNIQYFWVLSFCKLFFIKCHIIQHSELENLITPKTISQRLFKFSMKYLSKGTSFLLLSKHINYPLEFYRNNIFKINHPIPSIQNNNIEFCQGDKNKLAIVGLLSQSHKSCNRIYELEKNLKTNNKSLYAIGRNKGDFFINHESIVKYILWKNQFTSNEFNYAIKDIASFLFFFSPTCYNYTASGTIIDAILYGKNIIALEHPAINSAAYQYKGLLTFKSIEEMANFIDNNELPIIDTSYILSYINSRALNSKKNPDISIINEWLAY
ncbi:hypothetical protein [Providencia stuartii]|uniref:hypothetical protein n=1 Tax=Providencia stuartii TaxID=588 RepID=UPI0004F7544E|nr:hypothetical protein DR96_1012 [Providencia stuartii]MBK1419161.1 hypothetical protein [Providencia stuartii]QQC53228.1 hypothetical protein I6H97_04610 [Providencia stuartii]